VPAIVVFQFLKRRIDFQADAFYGFRTFPD
jgi:hypothetical protein